jgi:hypothetical protein
MIAPDLIKRGAVIDFGVCSQAFSGRRASKPLQAFQKGSRLTRGVPELPGGDTAPVPVRSPS